eukprot:m.37175 g.37175  ORF g.37175 m.37175 type:complete len:466 (+) comp5496_c0_seq1:2786-4183(+)
MCRRAPTTMAVTVGAVVLATISAVAPLDVSPCWRLTPAVQVPQGADVDVRGSYVDNMQLWVQHSAHTNTSSSSCWHVDVEVPVWVIEGTDIIMARAVEAAVREASTLSGASLRVLGSAGKIVVTAGDISGVKGLPSGAQVMRAASRAVRPLRVSGPPQHVVTELQLGVANPLVEGLVRLVEAPSLMETIEHLSSYHTRLSTSQGALDAEVWAVSQLIRHGFEVETYKFGTEGLYSANVIAKKTGTKFPNQWVIAGAHYDSRAENSGDKEARAPGADDNGSGSSAILELAKIIDESGVEFEYTLVLCLFSGEEQGLLGSRAYANHLADQGDVDVVAMFNADMLGYKLPDVEVTISFKDRSIANWLLETCKAYSALYLPKYKTGESSSCCSDYMSFHEAGFPAVGFFENTAAASNYPHYHKSTDLPSEINQENIEVLSKAFVASIVSYAGPDNDAMARHNAPILSQI